jgi:aspartyl-tRNA(Asn)/glutamyl-tRNA(Gln) amidotransferase subunit A
MPSGLPVLQAGQQSRMNKDLLEITISQLQALYAKGKYSVTDVTRWYMGRIEHYNGIYRAVQTVDVDGAMQTARTEDADKHGTHGPLWGVPVVIKANTAVKGVLNTDGWEGFAMPRHEFIASKDATVVARLRAAGAVIIGITNMPDFAASDTNRSTAFGRTGNAYDVRFSPGGSSGGTVTAITSDMALLGTGTDTANSIRMPSGTSAVVGLLPTRGLVSIAGIAPLDWLRDNTGPIARSVTDVAVGLGVMAAEDPLDFKTSGSAMKAQPGPYTQYLKADALRGKRFGVPAFIFSSPGNSLQPETRVMFMKAVDAIRSAGAEVVIDDTLLPASFLTTVGAVNTQPYRKDGADQWIGQFGPQQYHSSDEFTRATGIPWPSVFSAPAPQIPQVALKTDPRADANYFAPQRAALAEYTSALDQFRLDGLIYPSAQMPPPDETMPQNGRLSSGPHSATGWVNVIGVPAIVVPSDFYTNGLPFGLEVSARPWRDGDLLGFAYAYEQATKLRKPPILVERGLLPAK